MLTITDCLTGYTRVASRRTTDSAIEIAEQVFEGWFTLFGLPVCMASDRDKLFYLSVLGGAAQEAGSQAGEVHLVSL